MKPENLWRYTYFVQIAAAAGMFLALPLFWHQEHGTGLKLMNKALTTMIRFGIDPFNPSEIPVSQWWIVWIIPFMGFIIGLRAYLGLMFKMLAGQVIIIRLIGILLFLSSGWYILNFYQDLRLGFWLEVLFVGIQLLALLVEAGLPALDPPSESRFIAPIVSAESPVGKFSPHCPECGTLNDLDAQKCRICKASLYR